MVETATVSTISMPVTRREAADVGEERQRRRALAERQRQDEGLGVGLPPPPKMSRPPMAIGRTKTLMSSR